MTLQAWNSREVTKYSELKFAGKRLPSAFWDDTEDPYQLGGNFIVGQNGCMKMIHACQDPFDRLNAAQILTVLNAQE